jgi:large subunit ribosomal protein L25
MQSTKISASVRTGGGKGPARRLRVEGKIPAVAYGLGKAARSLAVSPDELVTVLFSELGVNTLLDVQVEGGEKFSAMLGEYQYHPVSRQLLHADLVEVDPSKPVDVNVPLELTGKAQGIVMGGKLSQPFRVIPVRCLPGKVPVKLTHDITELQLDGHVGASELKLPEGVEVRLPPKQTIALIMREKHAKGEEEAEGAAAAPGAAAAAPAAAKPAAKK